MHVKEKSTSQILRSDAFSWKNDVTNGILWCAWSHNEIQWLPQGIRRVSRVGDVGSELLKMVTAAVEAENLTGSIYI